jgi:hypothetical protein
MSSYLSRREIERIRAALFDGNRIEAIRLSIEFTGSGLKEAKGFVDGLEDELRQTASGRLSAPACDARGERSTARSDQRVVEFCDVIPPAPVDGWPGLIKVHRVYCFDFYSHEPEETELERVFESLPGYQGGGSWMWFGKDAAEPPWLSASSDFDGLTVVGIVREADWRAWDSTFRCTASHFPMQKDTGDEIDA